MLVERVRSVWFCAFLLISATASAEALKETKEEVSEEKLPIDEVYEDKEGGEATIDDILNLSIKELMQIEISVASKKKQKVSETPAAVYVVTQEDIKRSGAQTIPEALRIVPGVEVARLNAREWAITARGFNSSFANKLLVLMDGRSVYTPLFNGTYWAIHDTLLEDIERIEVVRGPGGAAWGNNAVNGVINIITKSAKDTQGGFASATVGTETRVNAGGRYGFALSENAHIRFYGKYRIFDDQVFQDGMDAFDEWQMGNGGFRLDWDVTQDDLITVQGDAFLGEMGAAMTMPTFSPPYSQSRMASENSAGGNVLARWTHRIEGDSELSLQIYYNGFRHAEIYNTEKRHSFEFAFHHSFPLLSINNILWGIGYRLSSDRIGRSSTFSVTPDSETIDLISLFVQDDLTLVPDSLLLSVGSKLTYNDFTDFEIEPSARLLWTPHEHHRFWAAISRAVRTPSRVEHGGRMDFAAFPTGPGGIGLMSIMGNQGVDSEELLAFEIGYRIRPMSRLSLDIAAFFNDWENLMNNQAGTPFFEPLPAPPHTVLPQVFQNNMHGNTWGVEVAGNIQILDRWRILTSFTYLGFDLDLAPGVVSTRDAYFEGRSPRYRFGLQSFVNLPYNMKFDTSFYFVDNLDNINIPSYTRLDLRLAWQPTEDLELSFVAQNLLDGRHPEFLGNSFPTLVDIERSFFAQLSYRF